MNHCVWAGLVALTVSALAVSIGWSIGRYVIPWAIRRDKARS